MLLEKLILKNYRNYEKLDIKFNSGINVIYGNNGQGKTNIVEAIFFCATGRSYRTSKDNELIKIGCSDGFIGLFGNDNGYARKIEIQLNKSDKKKVRINDIPAKKIGELLGNVYAVIFCPEDLMIVKEGPYERRRFIDIALSQIKPTYFYELQQYGKIIAQKNMLLKEIAFKKSLKETLEVWNFNLADKGARITKMRHDYLDRIAKHAYNQHFAITSGMEELTLRYKPSIKSTKNESIDVIKNKFLGQLDDVMNKEIEKGICQIGPHRDDFELYINSIDLKNFGSQGQQRTAVLALKTAEINIMKEDTEQNPILLLDDVMSELDAKRQEFLFNSLGEIQTFITCTEKNIFEGRSLENIAFYEISEGKLL